MSVPKVRVGTVNTEVVVDDGDGSGGILSLYHEPRGDDAGTGPATAYNFMDGEGRRTHKGPYLFTDRQDGELARLFFRDGKANLDAVAAVAQGIRRVASDLVKIGSPV